MPKPVPFRPTATTACCESLSERRNWPPNCAARCHPTSLGAIDPLGAGTEPHEALVRHRAGGRGHIVQLDRRPKQFHPVADDDLLKAGSIDADEVHRDKGQRTERTPDRGASPAEGCPQDAVGVT